MAGERRYENDEMSDADSKAWDDRVRESQRSAAITTKAVNERQRKEDW